MNVFPKVIIFFTKSEQTERMLVLFFLTLAKTSCYFLANSEKAVLSML
ncbi:hypothetical protein SAMN05421818_13123 [Myroides phaeus]|uniref:Uncharacterized protein n=1 Tax=Myroides phaeus TaxID=702745 RepID=A0A1G8GRD3_9FLAO|nr:hypothetical protein SAMN05421818_13123 [Myroides phaeus]